MSDSHIIRVTTINNIDKLIHSALTHCLKQVRIRVLLYKRIAESFFDSKQGQSLDDLDTK
jgi:hypothetical protein